jgi:hypothetical protein
MPNSGEVFVELVQKYVGCSLHSRKEELGSLVSRGVDVPAQAVLIKTNCGMFSLGIMHRAGVDHPLLSTPYRLGMAIAWLVKIGRDLHAIKKYTPAEMPKKGALLHYYTPGKNNNHVEWLLSDPDSTGMAEHGGGGRLDNAITAGISKIQCNNGRMLQEWWDPDCLLPGQGA